MSNCKFAWPIVATVAVIMFVCGCLIITAGPTRNCQVMQIGDRSQYFIWVGPNHLPCGRVERMTDQIWLASSETSKQFYFRTPGEAFDFMERTWCAR